LAFSLGNPSSGSGRRRYGAGNTALSEINVIPLVDVVLVLLIIFMLTAHVMEYGLEIKVPEVKQTSDTAEELPVVNITRNGTTFLNDKPVNIHRLQEEVQKRFKGAKAVYVRADGATVWDVLAQVCSELSDAHLEIKMVVKPLESGGK
jgi:biopolymer transport protein ExbD